MTKPLAELLRPEKLSDIIGQQHLIGKNKLIREIVRTKKPVSLVFWGPPGSGKTTLARIIAKETGADWIELSAVTSGVADVRRVIEHAEQNARLQIPTLLFVDEIHRFNKAQQDAFLPHVERGTITLIGATTENPSFEIITPLLSRSRVVVLEPLSKKDMIKLIRRGAKKLAILPEHLPSESVAMIAELSGGDGRVAQKRVPGYDKNGETHYNIISAFIKSMRGTDANAALYYLARMLQAGEDPKFIARRMVIFASEDIGVAAPAALNLAVSTFQAVTQLGMPEAQYALFHCAIVLTKTTKSRQVANAMNAALLAAKQHPDLPIPLQLRNAPTQLMSQLGYGDGYEWKANFQHPDGFLPAAIKNLNLFDS